MCSKTCCAGSAPRSRRSMRRSIPRAAPITAGITAMTMGSKRLSVHRCAEAGDRKAAEPRRATAPASFEARLQGAPRNDGAIERLDATALYRLMAWLSPAYPVGAFSYSSGIEWAVEAGDIIDAKTLRRWLAIVIGEGGGFCDAVFFVHAHRSLADADDRALHAVAELAAAFAPSKERHLETT